MAKISFNGQEYDSPDAMPPDVRKLYDLASGLLADKDGDGMADVFSTLLAGQQIDRQQVTTSSHFVVDGKVYTSLDDLPPEARQRYEQAMGQIDANRNGIPDAFEGMFGGAQASQPGPPASATTLPEVKVIGEGFRATRAQVVLIGFGAVILIGAIVFVALMFLAR